MKKRFLLIIVLFISLLAFSPILKAQTDKYYTLYNLIEKGDFEILDTDYWTADNQDSLAVVAGALRAESDGTNKLISIYNNTINRPTLDNTHIYYLKLSSMTTYASVVAMKTSIQSVNNGPDVDVFERTTIATSVWYHDSIVFTPQFNDVYYTQTTAECVGADTLNNISIDTYILLDLTAIFGAGFEPSISVFENIYLPAGYFDIFVTDIINITKSLTKIEVVIGAVLTWCQLAIDFIETAVGGSFMLQIALAIGAVPLGFIVLSKIIGIVKSFIRK